MQQTSAGKNLMTPQEYFSELQQPKNPRSSFDRGCEILTTMDAGFLCPIFWDEVLPSDTWNVGQRLFGRVTTLIKPLMDNLYLDIHWFFVPNRIIFTNWVNLMGEQVDPAVPVAYTVPQVYVATSTPGGTIPAAQEIGDYLGLPWKDNQSVSALPFRSYLKIYDDYYRDENLIAETLPVSQRGTSGVTYGVTGFGSLLQNPRRRAKRKDYFTSALPWAQKGTAPSLYVTGTAPVTGIGKLTNQNFPLTNGAVWESDLGTATYANYSDTYSVGADHRWAFEQNPAAVGYPNIKADMTQGFVGFTLNAFREFVTLQQYLELDARGGSRYVEHLYNRYGVQPEDARLQRAEYLGGQTFDLMVTPVAQTSESGSGTPQANLSGMGTFSAKGHQFVKSFTEDGIIMCIASVRQEQRYQFGLARKWTRSNRYDFYDPIFANLGEQPILNQELYYSSNPVIDTQVWGYQEAWAEYRYSPSIITGKFRSDDPQSLDVWHLAQDPSGLAPLAPAFIEENPPMDRVLAVTDEPAFIINGRFDINCARPMPTRSIPGLTRL